MNETEDPGSHSLLNGRMNRATYAWVAPVVFLVPLLVAWAVLYATNWSESEIEWGLPLGMVVFVITIVCQLVGTGITIVRRANDCGKDRSLAALLLIPVANVIVLIYLMFPASVVLADESE